MAEQVTGIDADVLETPRSINLADSALHAPQASFGGQDFYPDLIDKAAVLACHIAWNHPLPDGNKRASWACLVLFLDLNGVGGIPIRRTSMSRRGRSSQWRHTTWTKCGLRTGCGSEHARRTRDGSASK